MHRQKTSPVQGGRVTIYVFGTLPLHGLYYYRDMCTQGIEEGIKLWLT